MANECKELCHPLSLNPAEVGRTHLHDAQTSPIIKTELL